MTEKRKSSWEKKRALPMGEDRQIATLLLWTPRTVLFHTLKDSSEEIYMYRRATSKFHYKGKKKIFKFKIKVGVDLHG